MSRELEQQVLDQLTHLSDAQQIRVLEFVRSQATTPAGEPGSALLRFAGLISPADLDQISQAIQEGCEGIDPNGW